VLVGLADSVWSIVVISYRQRQVPDAILGRVTSAFRTLGIGATSVGTIIGGALSQWLGLRAPFLAGAAVLLASTLLALLAIDGAAFRAG
jgi:MFS family permease